MSFKTSFLNQTAHIPSTTIITAPASGLWQISVCAITTVVAGTSSDDYVVLDYSDQTGAQSISTYPSALNLNALPSVFNVIFAIMVMPGPIALSTFGNYNGGTFNVYVVGEFIASFPA